jgi:hypothetical protein
LRSMFINLGVEVSPQVKSQGVKSGEHAGHPISPRNETIQLGTFLSKFPANGEQCGLCPSPAVTRSPLNHQIPPILAGGNSLTFYNTEYRLQSRSHNLSRKSKDPLHLNGTKPTRL